MVFQFQYGTIKSLIVSLQKQTKKAGFNSSMVRLKEYKSKMKTEVKIVSIPVWYD